METNSGIAALGVCIAFCTAIVAYGQWKFAQHRLRLDLFEKRYRIFSGVRDFIISISQNSNFENDILFKLDSTTIDAEFLFEQELVLYISEIRSRALRMRSSERKFRSMADSVERQQLVDFAHQELAVLSSEMKTLSERFKPYLGFSHIRL